MGSKLTKILFHDKLDSSELPDLDKTVIHFLSHNSNLDQYLKDIAINLVTESHLYQEIQYGYKIIATKNVFVEKEKIFINQGMSFDSGKVISSQLHGIEGLVVFTATLGRNYDYWFKGLFDSGDPLKGYIADLIGSITVEAAVDILEEKIIEDLSIYGMSCSNRYSPGYCDWDVSEQQKLFSFLPSNFCDIELTESSLMVPIKSVSGIIGIGKNIKKKAYACQICTQENCYLNKMKAV